MYTSPVALVQIIVNEISRNKVVVPEGVAGLVKFYIRLFLLVEFSFTLNYCVVQFGMV